MLRMEPLVNRLKRSIVDGLFPNVDVKGKGKVWSEYDQEQGNLGSQGEPKKKLNGL